MNNATRWPGYGRTSGMRCVIARAEHVMDWLQRLSDLTLFSAQARSLSGTGQSLPTTSKTSDRFALKKFLDTAETKYRRNEKSALRALFS
ncbi:hypothetical protein WKG85_04415 [Pantoea agglomerans]|uniref:hypothetical protein n=1 Tax=Enterobacter agglomerans TaxID=549 RepID=UPI003C7A67A6